MYSKIVETMEEWLEIKQWLIDKNFKLWQCQFDSENPEGVSGKVYVWCSSI